MKHTYINHESAIPIQKLGPFVIKNGSRRLKVRNEVEDRIKKLDAHAIWSITLNFSSRSAFERGINVLSGIGYYYTLFHCIFAMICLDFDISEGKLRRVSHNQLARFLKMQVKQGVATKRLLELLTDARFTREYANYLSGQSGHDKFMSLRHTPRSLITDSFGKLHFNDFVNKLSSACAQTIDEFIKMLKNTENHFSCYIFPVLHRNSDFDYYGEDFLDNFFPPNCKIVTDIEEYLIKIEE